MTSILRDIDPDKMVYVSGELIYLQISTIPLRRIHFQMEHLLRMPITRLPIQKMEK